MLAKILLLPVRIVPTIVPTLVITSIANRLLESQQLKHRLQDIDGAVICVNINDIDWNLYFKIQDSKICSAKENNWDMRISGNLINFMALASRTEDPDTLFFNRSLVLEGKTETGLYVKNLLDAVDLGFSYQVQALTGKTPPEFISKTVSKNTDRLRLLLARFIG